MMQEILQTFQNGDFVLVVDDENRENEGDLVIAAEKITDEKMAFLLRHSSGIICVPLTSERLEELQLPQMVTTNTESNRTAFTVSVDARDATTTGISAKDRTATVKALIDPATEPCDLLRPGHIFPLRASEGGTLKRAGHTEAGVDLAILSGLMPAAVISEIVNDDGSVAKGQELVAFAKQHNIPMISVAEIIRYRRQNERLIECVSTGSIPTEYGPFTAHVYRCKLDGIEHMALVFGDVKGDENVLVRVHSECLTGDVFGSKRCDCGQQLSLAMKMIAEAGSGVIVYLRGHEGRGIGLAHKIRAYNLQDQGRDTVEANLDLGLPIDSREYGIGAQILADLGVQKLRVLTNNPAKYGGLDGYDLEIVERVALQTDSTEENARYLATKKEKMGHIL